MKTFLLAVLASLLAFGASIADAQVTTRVVVTTGDESPDGNGEFGLIGIPSINGRGDVAFSSTLTGTDGGSADDRGVFKTRYGAVAQAAREGQAALVGSASLFSLGGPSISEYGDVAFSAEWATSVPRERAYYQYVESGLLLRAAKTGLMPVNGVGPLTTMSTRALLNARGRGAFQASNASPDAGQGIYGVDALNPGGALFVIAHTGQAAPGGGVFTAINEPALNGGFDVAFSASLSDGTTGLFGGTGTSTIQYARTGQQAPGGTNNFTAFGGTAINDRRDLAFVGFAGGNHVFMYRNIFGQPPLESIARSGQTVPGGDGVFADFSGVLGPPAINNRRQAVFGAVLSGTSGNSADNRGLYFYDETLVDAAGLMQIARRGQTAPDGNGRFAEFSEASLNDDGRTAFYATLLGTQRGGGDDTGIYFFDQALGVVQVAREGQSFLGSEIRDLALLGHPSNGGSGRRGLNNFGQLAYRFILADDRIGIAVATLPTDVTGDHEFTVVYRTPQGTGPLIAGFDPLPPTVAATFRLDNLALGQTTVGLDQVLTFDIDLPGGGAISRSDLNDFELTLDANGAPSALTWSANGDAMAPGVIIGNNNFALTISGVVPETQDEFNYIWSESTNVLAFAAPSAGADFNDDAVVDGSDLTLWASTFGDDGAVNYGDADGDGNVDGNDFLSWQRAIGVVSAAPSSSAVPEPATTGWALLLLGACRLGRRGMHRGGATSPGPVDRR